MTTSTIAVTALRQMRGTIRRPAQIVYLVALSVGLASAALLHLWMRSRGLLGAQAVARAQARSLVAAYSVDVALALQPCPAAFVIMLRTTLWILPAAIVLIGSTSREARVITAPQPVTRAPAGSLILGTALGFLASVAGALLAACLLVTLATCLAGEATLGEALRWGATTLGWSLVSALPYVGLTTAVTAGCSRSMRSLVLGLGLVFLFWMIRFTVRTVQLAPQILWLLPGTYEASLLGRAGSAAGLGAGGMIVWTAVSLAVASGLYRRRSTLARIDQRARGERAFHG
jgi:hypothetical protein